MGRKKKDVIINKNEGLALPASAFDIVQIQDVNEELASSYFTWLEKEFGEENVLGYVDGSIEIPEEVEGLAFEKLRELSNDYIEKVTEPGLFDGVPIDKDGLVILKITKNYKNYLCGSYVSVDKKNAAELISVHAAEFYVKTGK